VTLVATDVGGVGVDRVEWSLDGGPPQVYAAPLTVAADGEHVVAFRAVDAAGNVEPTRTVAFRLDGSAPRVAPAGLRPGARYGDAGRVFPTVATTDAGSGVASLRVTLDGRPVSLGAALWLYRLPLGEHALRITALDLAGNATRRTVRFRTVTSLKDLARLVRRFRDDGRLGPRGRVVAATLGRELAVARRLAGARRRPAARRALARFAAAAAQARDGTARRVLRRDAAAVARALR
jgi:hypothetical protein